MSSEIIALMFYQHCHDKDYHHDIYILNRKARLNHLVHHLHKYNNAGIKPVMWLEDMFACLLSMAGTMNLHLDKEIEKLLHHKINDVKDITALYAPEAIESKLDENLRLLSKTMESSDQKSPLQQIDYNGTLRKCISELAIITFQLNTLKNEETNFELVCRYMKRLEMIKERHCFYDYFHSSSMTNNETYRSLRRQYLTVTAKEDLDEN